MSVLGGFRSGIIVSCQANPGNPFFGSQYMALMAQAAEKSGAVGLRVNGSSDIAAVKKTVRLPVIGSNRIYPPIDGAYITPTIEMAKEVADAGADIITLDATPRTRPGGVGPGELIKQIKDAFGRPVMADISTFEEGLAAAEAGADLVATTLSGYTPYSSKTKGPDLDLIQRLARAIDKPVICEGRIWTIDDARDALDRGAYAVVIGTAITNPMAITKRFIEHCTANTSV